MSRSIRFLTERGFSNLIKDIQTKFPFLNTIEQSNNFLYLGVDGLTTVYINYNTKEVTPINLSYKVFYEKGIKMLQLANEGLEEAKTRKTLFKKLLLMKDIADEFHRITR